MTVPDLDPEQRAALQEGVITWFLEHQRDLPWRQGYQPYQVWISEIMLQQTQMERGIEYCKRWLKEFPDLAGLAAAPEERVLKLWEGLGYYSRARNLHRCARLLMDEFSGRIPDDPVQLEKLPGIGPYTAGAIASIAFNRDAPLVDGNVGRLFARLFDLEIKLGDAAGKRLLWQLAAELLPTGRARLFNQGLMELGALICPPKTPNCTDCPLSTHCLARQRGLTGIRPLPNKGPAMIPIEMATGVLVHDGRIFIQRRRDQDVWGGLWEFPGGGLEPDETPEATVPREFLEETGLAVRITDKITTVVHHYTRYRVTLHGYTCRLANGHATPALPVLSAAQDCGWVCPERLDDYPFPSGHRQLIDWMKEEGWFD